MLRRLLLIAISVLGVAVLISACGGSNSTGTSAASASNATSGGASTSGGTPTNGGVLTVGLPGDIVSADPALNSDGNSYWVAEQVLQGLVNLAPGSLTKIVPQLATALPTVSNGGRTYTFHLRQGITFSDGTPFNAAAVKYNYVRQQLLPKSLQNSYDYYYGDVFGGFGNASNIKSIDTPDQYTVVFNLKQPQSNFLITQTIPAFFIQSPTALKAGDADNPNPAKSKYYTGQGTGMVGTGPFIFKSWVPNSHINLVKNPHYWDASQAAHVDAVTITPEPDQTAELNALQAGTIDVAVTISPSLVSVIKKDPNLTLIPRPQPCNSGQIGITETHAPLNNKLIRLAMAYAVHPAAYIKAFYGGMAQVPENWMPMDSQDAVSLNLPQYNPQEARQLIKQSGLSGSQLTINFWYPSGVARAYMPDPKDLFEAISNDLTAVGFKVVPHTETWNTYVADAVAGKFPADILGWTCDFAGPDDYLKTWLFGYVGGKPNPQFAYSNPQLNTVMNQALATADPTKARNLWVQAQHMIRNDMPTIPLVNAEPPGAAASFVKGYVGSGNVGNEFLNLVWLSK